MPYCSETRIYPGTTQSHLIINIITWTRPWELSMPNQWARPRQLSMSTTTLASILLMPNQWAQSLQLSISTRTVACKLSMPNQWARSLQLLMSARTLACNYQCQTNEHDLVSYQCQHGHKHLIDQCQTSGHDQLLMSTQTQPLNWTMPNKWLRSATWFLKTRNNYSLAVNSTESLYLLTIFGFYIKD